MRTLSIVLALLFSLAFVSPRDVYSTTITVKPLVSPKGIDYYELWMPDGSAVVLSADSSLEIATWLAEHKNQHLTLTLR